MGFINVLMKEKSAGYSLIEMMVALAISSIAGMQAYSVIHSSEEINHELDKKYSYTQLLTQIQRLLNKQEFLDEVYTDNPVARNCINNYHNCPKDGARPRAIPVNIYSKRPGKTPRKVIGTRNSPVYYDKRGTLVALLPTHIKSRFSLQAHVTPSCGYCDNGDYPENMEFTITLKERNPQNIFVVKKQFKVFQLIRDRKEPGIIAQTCGSRMDAGQTVKYFARGFNGGRLNCSWTEGPSNRPDKKGDRGIGGIRGGRGSNGSTGNSRCYLDHTYGGTEYCGSRSGAASYCSSAQANENTYN